MRPSNPLVPAISPIARFPTPSRPPRAPRDVDVDENDYHLFYITRETGEGQATPSYRSIGEIGEIGELDAMTAVRHRMEREPSRNPFDWALDHAGLVACAVLFFAGVGVVATVVSILSLFFGG